MRSHVVSLAILSAVCFGLGTNARALDEKTAEPPPDVVSFGQHIRPIMSESCFVCHGPDDAANVSGVRLDSFEAAVSIAEVIVPGAPHASPVWQRISGDEDPMPPPDYRHQLTDRQKKLIHDWIQQGAKYDQHWSYKPIAQPAVPQLDSRWQALVRNPIDAFILAKLVAAGIEPSPLAEKETLLRRLSLDLIGLPPTVREIEDFVADDAPDAYERQVDRLMASPHYGERMAAGWLDLVRFSDTVGFHGDQNQRIFPYRDFVIQSLNENQPFDEFTQWQIGGDLFHQPTQEQLVATGLLRLNMMTREGGAQPEEYLAKYTADRVRMIGTAWLGSTVGCCECHNHKYDPFTIEDFYSLGAFFDDIRQWGVYQNYGYTPNPDLTGFSNDHPFPPEMRMHAESLDHQVRYLEKKLECESAKLVSRSEFESEKFSRWIQQLVEEYRQAPDLWCPLRPARVDGNSEQLLEVLADDSLLFRKKSPGNDPVELIYDIERPMSIRALRCEVLPHEIHGNRVGRSRDGRFNLRILVKPYPNPAQSEANIPVRPRFVRIELPGRGVLSLAEVQVFAGDSESGSINIAADGRATQSSTAHDAPAELAIDNNTDGDFNGGRSTTHTRNEQSPWWELDLGQETQIDRIVFWNRTDGETAKRLQGFRLVLLDAQRNVVFTSTPPLPKPELSLDIPDQFARVNLIPATPIAFAQADRRDPLRYSNGRPHHYLADVWRSGPGRWQLPTDEAGYPHTAVYHFNETLHLNPGQQLMVRVDSQDVGRTRFSVSPFSRFTVSRRSSSAALDSALAAIAAGRDYRTLEDDADAALRSAFYQQHTPFDQQQDSIRKLQDSIANCRSAFAMTMVSQPLDETSRRQSRILPRGDWQDKSGKPVSASTPHFLPRLQSVDAREPDRLDLAKWLVSRDNPLTARHYVNRVWKHFFGKGLSNTLDDLGSQGEWPSHPELLDWLAWEFQQDWNRKNITRLIVTSHTYRQQAAARADLSASDPDNRMLAQQSARRLEAEIVRDNALAISGLLLRDWIGGPSVFPFQPAGHYGNLQFPNRRYLPDSDGCQYRRGIYMHWQRTFLHPMLANFDAPARDECAASRIVSNSPQQALTLLNDPVFVEASRAFAVRLRQRLAAGNIDDWITEGFRIAVSRAPDDAERDALQQLYLRQLAYFQRHPDRARSFQQTGAFQPEASLDQTELAALAQVCRVILNLHETITRY